MHLCAITNIESIHVKKILKYIASKGHRIDVIGFDKAEITELRYHQVRTPLAFRSRKLKYLWSVIATRKIIKKIKPDILLSIYLIGPGALGALCNYHPHVIMALGSDVLLEMKKSFLYRLLTRFIIRRTDHFISVSKAISERLNKRGVLQEHIFINPIGVDTKLFNYSEPIDKNEKFQIVSTRKLDPLYNVQQFINSLPIVYEKCEGFDVIISSTGPEYEGIQKSIVDYGLEERVKLIGDASLPVLLDILKKSHVFVSVPFSDGAPVSLFEAMACGCFPILSDIPANQDWVEDGKNGYLVPLGNPKMLADRLLEAMSTPSLLNKARLINRQIVEEQLEFSNLADNMIEYLNSTIKIKA